MSVINALKSGGSVNLTETEALVEELEVAVGTYPYSVANTLTNCTTNNNSTTAQTGSSYSAIITADEGYTLTGATISVVMGGNNITSTAYNNGAISIASVVGDIEISVSAVPSVEYFVTFESPSSFTLATANSTKNWDGTLEYSTDKTNWNTWAGISAISSGADNKLYLRGTNNTYITGDGANKRWVFTGSNITAKGNIENLLDYATVELGNHPSMAQHCFHRLFQYTPLTDVSGLIFGAETLTDYCYARMFWESSVQVAPQLPATTLAPYCYYAMFDNCFYLTTPSYLPATRLHPYCYKFMYAYCTSLNKLIDFPAFTGTATEICMNMFRGCTNIKLSTTQTGEYTNVWYSPYTSTSTPAYAYTDMFTDTGGTWTGTPGYGAVYYTSNDIIDGTEE